jgi:hypothetical protein
VERWRFLERGLIWVRRISAMVLSRQRVVEGCRGREKMVVEEESCSGSVRLWGKIAVAAECCRGRELLKQGVVVVERRWLFSGGAKDFPAL